MRPVLRLLTILSDPQKQQRLVEEPNNLSGHVLPTSLLVVHNTSRSCENDITELTGGEQLDDPLLKLGKTDVVSRGDDTTLVQAILMVSTWPAMLEHLHIPAVEFNDNLAGPVVIDLREFTDEA